MEATAPPLSLRVLHRTSAFVLGCFLIAHLINHVAGLAGQAQHVAFMHALRPWYRNPVVEPVLLALFVFQAATGITMAARGWRQRRGRVAWLQAISGVYLAVFLLVHIASVILGRVVLGLDTDFRFAAAGFHVAGWPWYFAPYYSSLSLRCSLTSDVRFSGAWPRRIGAVDGSHSPPFPGLVSSLVSLSLDH
jgi:succinate dehydrogenase/fumarate reductase cytochrome b subunit